MTEKYPTRPPEDASLVFVQPINHLQRKNNPKTYTHVQSKPPRHHENIYMSRTGELEDRWDEGWLRDDASNPSRRIIPVNSKGNMPSRLPSPLMCNSLLYFWRPHITGRTSNPYTVCGESLVPSTHLEHAICRERGLSAAHRPPYPYKGVVINEPHRVVK